MRSCSLFPLLGGEQTKAWPKCEHSPMVVRARTSRGGWRSWAQGRAAQPAEVKLCSVLCASWVGSPSTDTGLPGIERKGRACCLWEIRVSEKTGIAVGRACDSWRELCCLLQGSFV